MASETLQNTEQKMQRITEGLSTELTSIRTGRATPALIDRVKVEYAGALMPINQIATISIPNARLLTIQPWDKGSINNIEKAILKSDLGLNPVSDGNMLRLNIPPLSEERRQELIKIVRRRVEERKVAIRNLRRDALEELKQLEKNKEISQDEYKHAQAQLQKLTDSYIASTDQIGRKKEADLVEG